MRACVRACVRSRMHACNAKHAFMYAYTCRTRVRACMHKAQKWTDSHMHTLTIKLEHIHTQIVMNPDAACGHSSSVAAACQSGTFPQFRPPLPMVRTAGTLVPRGDECIHSIAGSSLDWPMVQVHAYMYSQFDPGSMDRCTSACVCVCVCVCVYR